VVYGQAFAIYALAEWYRASSDQSALDLALDTFRLLEDHARDRVGGGYYEACSNDWSRLITSALSDLDIACAKSMNTNLHVMEALTCLLAALIQKGPAAAGDADRVRQALQDLVNVHLDHIMVTPAHLGLYYNADWTSLSELRSYGHDIEASWLMTEAAELAWDGQLPGKVREAALNLARRTLEILAAFGPGLIHEGPSPHLDLDRIWWVQAECLVGLLNAACLNPDQLFIQQARAVWEYIKEQVKDPLNGEWFWNTRPDGTHADQPKGGLWKTSYHNGRACLEGMHRLDRLMERLK
jgi:mannobiose 2-epimerase